MPIGVAQFDFVSHMRFAININTYKSLFKNVYNIYVYRYAIVLYTLTNKLFLSLCRYLYCIKYF